jgi:hypothetical protein
MTKPRKSVEDSSRQPSGAKPTSAARQRGRVSTPRGARASSSDRAGLSERPASVEPPAPAVGKPGAARIHGAASKRATAKTAGFDSPAPAKVPHQLMQADIAQRAYAIYLGRGGAPGDPLDDWIEAENQLRTERSKG